MLSKFSELVEITGYAVEKAGAMVIIIDGATI
jgi:hypothetical protein